MFPFPLWWTFSQLQAKDELEKRQNESQNEDVDLSFLDAFNESSDSDDDFS